MYDMFTDKPGLTFANHRLWEASGYAIAYAYSDYLCTDVKLVICLVILSLGMVGYIAVEVMRKRDSQEQYSLLQPPNNESNKNVD